MADLVTVTGVRNVIRNLQRKDKAFQRGIERGLKKGGLLIQREAQLLVPVDTGALKASAFTRSEGTGFQTEVKVGFDTAYAVFVHEARGTYWGLGIRRAARYPGHRPKGNYWDPAPRAVPKFLQIAVGLKTPEVIKVVRQEAWKAKYA